MRLSQTRDQARVLSGKRACGARGRTRQTERWLVRCAHIRSLRLRTRHTFARSSGRRHALELQSLQMALGPSCDCLLGHVYRPAQNDAACRHTEPIAARARLG